MSSNKGIRWIFYAAFILIILGVWFYWPLINTVEGRGSNVILISWDGYQRNHLDQQLEAGELPNLKTFMENGVRVDTHFVYQVTQTKPAHASMLTGIHPIKLGIFSNHEIFRTVPTNTTILERAEQNFEEIITGFIAGKMRNIKPCFENLTGLDYVFIDDVQNNVTGPKVINFIKENHDKQFFLFYHTRDPDKTGHIYGENSINYSLSGTDCDYWLGEILDELKKQNLMDNTLVYITTDHGFEENGFSHLNEQETWLISNDLNIKDHTLSLPALIDIAPTIGYALGLHNSDDPYFEGYPLQRTIPPSVNIKRVNLLSDNNQVAVQLSLADKINYVFNVSLTGNPNRALVYSETSSYNESTGKPIYKIAWEREFISIDNSQHSFQIMLNAKENVEKMYLLVIDKSGNMTKLKLIDEKSNDTHALMD